MSETKRFLSKAEVRAKIQLSYAEIGRRVKAGRFPKPIRLGPFRTSRTVFLEALIEAWMDEQIAKPDA